LISSTIARYGALVRWKLAKYFSVRTNSVLCPACGDPTRMIGKNARFPLVKCETCGHASVAHMPHDEELRLLYDGLRYWRDDKRHQGICSFTEGDWTGYLAPRLHSIYTLAGFADGTPKSVLEIGCSEGRLLAELKKHGHDVLGYECNADLAARGSSTFGVTIVGAGFTAAQVVGQSFDLVLAYHTLEHVANVARMVEDIALSLNPDGKAVIELPLETVYDNPDHVHFFTHESIRALFGRYFQDIILHPNGFKDSHGNYIGSVYVVTSSPKRCVASAGK